MVICWWGFLPAAASGDAGLRTETPQIDLGEVMAGTVAVATFVFHNDGDHDVKILRAKPS
jgi:hypothetical protein